MLKTINRAIAKELETSKRLVVPEFGAFIRKDTGEVVFVEFLKKNDQVLESVMRKELSMSELEAGVAIEEFVDNLKKEVQQRGRYVIEGLGSMVRDKEGIYELKYDPQVKAEVEEVRQKPLEQVVEHEIEYKQTVANVPPPVTVPQQTHATNAPVEKKSEQPRPQKSAAQRPVKVESQKRSKADLVMIIAIAAALVAIAAMIFGYTTGGDPLKKIKSTTQPQQEQSAELER